MEDNSDGFIILPGGIGTLDEFFEILVLKNKGIWDKPIVLFNHKDFFNDLILFMKKIIKENMMKDVYKRQPQKVIKLLWEVLINSKMD